MHLGNNVEAEFELQRQRAECDAYCFVRISLNFVRLPNHCERSDIAGEAFGVSGSLMLVVLSSECRQCGTK